jgi:CDP-6-deoxy-D-xylo-4-hexulose-3-dehydrase
MKVSYANRVYDHREKENLKNACDDFWLTHSKWCNKFEKDLSSYLGVKKSLLVNSGSSANLLAFMCLTQPELEKRQIKRGDEVITTACCFPTTLAPIVQYGATPVFVDITIPEYNINIKMLEQALTKKTKAVLIAHTLGNPFDIQSVVDFCKKHNLWLIEDNCDALGSEYRGLKTGTFGDISTCSFYPAHHITTGEGGAVCTNNDELYKIMISLRDWGRECACMSGHDNVCGNRFSGEYDHKYVYSHFGYNLKATEFQGAIGVAQLEKLNTFISKRQKNWRYFREALLPLKDHLILPTYDILSNPSWFGFCVTLKKGNRNDFAIFLESKGIQTRPLFAGNILKQPCFKDVKHKVIGQLANTNKVYKNTLWFGVHPSMNDEQKQFVVETINLYFS